MHCPKLRFQFGKQVELMNEQNLGVRLKRLYLLRSIRIWGRHSSEDRTGRPSSFGYGFPPRLVVSRRQQSPRWCGCAERTMPGYASARFACERTGNRAMPPSWRVQ